MRILQSRKVLDQIRGFTYTLVKQAKKKPHLRCSAAQVRALIPFGKEIVDSLFDGGNAEEKAARAAMGHMLESTSRGEILGHACLSYRKSQQEVKIKDWILGRAFFVKANRLGRNALIENTFNKKPKA